ncbi:DUF1016 N-terminal domain-containing protein [Subtercola boreus]|uniref:DUF1016 N-terminal domain-containing protein n=1 Tax=Subtercola boreus TaxID=120213 RepID=UPI00267AC66A
MAGFSVSNLKYMRRLSEMWPDEAAIGPQLVDQLPWGYLRVLMAYVDDETRGWYVRQAVELGWSRAVL